MTPEELLLFIDNECRDFRASMMRFEKALEVIGENSHVLSDRQTQVMKAHLALCSSSLYVTEDEFKKALEALT